MEVGARCQRRTGGRADQGQRWPSLLIIECKTAGSEFKRAWSKTLEDGDQLFSYAQQISETQFLCLYASDLDVEQIRYTSYVIAHRDNEKYLSENPDFKSFRSDQRQGTFFRLARHL